MLGPSWGDPGIWGRALTPGMEVRGGSQGQRWAGAAPGMPGHRGRIPPDSLAPPSQPRAWVLPSPPRINKVIQG